MEKKFMKLIEQIMEIITNNEYKPLLLDGEKFHYIDKDRMIDFQATLGNHNYYLKDNISNNTYIATRKKMGEGTYIHQIILDNNTNKYYSALFSRNDLSGLIKSISLDKNGSLICTNSDIIKRLRDEDAFMEYVDEVFEDDDLDENEDAPSTDNNSELEYAIDNQPEVIENVEVYEQIEEDDEEDIFENEFQVTVNGKEINGESKIKAISSCVIDLTNRYYKLKDIEMFAENLKLVLKDMKEELERDM